MCLQVSLFPEIPHAQAGKADLCSSCGEIYHIQSMCMFGSVFRSSVQACKGVPSVPQQVMTDDAQWELRWGRVLFLSVYALRSFLQRCTWTATAQLRKDEERRDKPGKIKKADL